MPEGGPGKFGGPGLISLSTEEHKEHKNPVAEAPWKQKLHGELNKLLEKVVTLKNEKSRQQWVEVVSKTMFAADGIFSLSDTLDKLEATNGSGIRQQYQDTIKKFIEDTNAFVDLALDEEKTKEGN